MIDETILHYKILEKLGEGGMGEVFKAQDTKLDRFVALKFLPTQLTSTGEEKERFIQEAKAASAMNHPNVCTIHSIEEHNSQLFIVMEYIDGTTLRDMKGTLSEKRILDIGIQVAEGLGAAHEKGIVHRDIKPENIMIRKDGIAQIMDFGLAKLYTSSNVSRLTKAGTTMGTMGYMSPEQVQGLDLDHRSDIFSLGVVLYELFAGESPFKGMHETAIMYEIVNVEAPPIATVKTDIDPSLDGLILECLEKEKDERCQSAKELAKNLRKIKRVSTGNRTSRMYNVNTSTYQAKSSVNQISSKSSGSIAIEVFDKRFDLGNFFKSGIISWGLSFILLLLFLYFAVFQKPVVEEKITTFASILPPLNTNISRSGIGDIQISHDGKTLAFMARDTTDNNKNKLWIRPLNSNAARSLPGCDGASYIFWSPDNKSIAFFNNGSLMKVNIHSGLPIKICDAPQGRGGTWNNEGKIVFAPEYIGGLYLVSANGGTPEEIVKSDSTNKEESLRFPFFLPDGKHFIYTVQSKFSGSSSGDIIKIGSIDGSTDKIIFREPTNVQYAEGYIFFVRQSTLMAQKFDEDNFELSGDAQTIAGNIRYNDGLIGASFSVSNSGNIFLQNDNISNINMELYNLKTRKSEFLFERKIFILDGQFSPNGKKIVFTSPDLDGKNSNIWTYDIASRNITRITFQNKRDGVPVWSPDGKYLAFSSFHQANYDMFIKNSDGTGNATLIYQSDYYKRPADWSMDGNDLLFNEYSPNSSVIYTLQLNNKNKAHTYISSDFFQAGLKFSKDKKWILYSSNESGNRQLYLRAYDGTGTKWQVTNERRGFVGWINNDKELIVQDRSNRLYKINISLAEGNIKIGSTEFLADLPNNVLAVHNISPDGKNVLITTSGSASISLPFTYIQNWKGLINEKED